MVKVLVRFTVWTIRSMPRDQKYQRQVSSMMQIVTNSRRKVSVESKTLIDRRLKDKGSCNHVQCFSCKMHVGKGRGKKNIRKEWDFPLLDTRKPLGAH